MGSKTPSRPGAELVAIELSFPRGWTGVATASRPSGEAPLRREHARPSRPAVDIATYATAWEPHLLRAQRLSDADQRDEVAPLGNGGIAVRQYRRGGYRGGEACEQAAEVENVGGGVRSGEALDDGGSETGREVDDVVGGAAEEIVGLAGRMRREDEIAGGRGRADRSFHRRGHEVVSDQVELAIAGLRVEGIGDLDPRRVVVELVGLEDLPGRGVAVVAGFIVAVRVDRFRVSQGPVGGGEV